MKKIATKYFGEVEVDESTLLHFAEGMWGFEEHHSYALISFGDDDQGLMCLQSLDDAKVGFVVVNPFVVQPDYAPALDAADEAALGIGADTPASFLAVVVLKEDLETSTANLRCPVVVNLATREGKQVVLPDDYPLRLSLSAVERGA